ncbi:hypothetical protein ACTXT7_005093 [Hymenolepis weldensis]
MNTRLETKHLRAFYLKLLVNAIYINAFCKHGPSLSATCIIPPSCASWCSSNKVCSPPCLLSLYSVIGKVKRLLTRIPSLILIEMHCDSLRRTFKKAANGKLWNLLDEVEVLEWSVGCCLKLNMIYAEFVGKSFGAAGTCSQKRTYQFESPRSVNRSKVTISKVNCHLVSIEDK